MNMTFINLLFQALVDIVLSLFGIDLSSIFGFSV